MAKLLFLVTAAAALAMSASLADESRQAPSAGFPRTPGSPWTMPLPPPPGWMPPPPWFYHPLPYAFPQLSGTAGQGVEALRHQLGEHKHLLAEARLAAESLAGERDRWQAEALDAAQSERDALASRQAVFERSLGVLKADNSQMKAALGACTERVAELSEERDALADQVEQSARAAAETGEALSEARAGAMELEGALVEASGRNAALAADNARLQAEVDRLQAKLAASSDALSESGLQLERLNGERHALQAERDQARQAVAAVRHALEQVDAMTVEMSSLEGGAERQAGADAGEHLLDQTSKALSEEMQAKSSPRPAPLQAP